MEGWLSAAQVYKDLPVTGHAHSVSLQGGPHRAVPRCDHRLTCSAINTWPWPDWIAIVVSLFWKSLNGVVD